MLEVILKPFSVLNPYVLYYSDRESAEIILCEKDDCSNQLLLRCLWQTLGTHENTYGSLLKLHDNLIVCKI